MSTAPSPSRISSRIRPHWNYLPSVTLICVVTGISTVASGCTHESDQAHRDEPQQVEATHAIAERDDSQEPNIAAVTDEAQDRQIIEALFGGDDNLRAADLVYISTETTVPSEHRKLAKTLARHGEKSKEFDLAFRDNRLSTNGYAYSAVIGYLKANSTSVRLTKEIVCRANCKLADASTFGMLPIFDVSPDSRAVHYYVGLSRVGYSNDRNTAVLYMQCTSGPLSSGGSLLLFRKRSTGKWELVERDVLWIG